jgi:hypothetical protein
MNKIKIMDQINIYRNVFSEYQLNLLLNEIKKSETLVNEIKITKPEDSAFFDYHGDFPQKKEDGSCINTWVPWYTYGTKSFWSPPKKQNKNKKLNNLQEIGFYLVSDALHKIHNDYVNEYKNTGTWTYNIEDWSLHTSEKSMELSQFEILKHKKNINSEYTIDVHTDWHSNREEQPGPKQIFTYTIYLNDDYEGGEIDFVDEKNKHLISYKPKKGDITVFPSGRPFWHAARGVKSDESKYLIRTFSMFHNPVNQAWIDGLKKHGPTLWMEMELEKNINFAKEGKVTRKIFFEGQDIKINKDIKINEDDLAIFIKKQTYIDGRKI